MNDALDAHERRQLHRRFGDERLAVGSDSPRHLFHPKAPVTHCIAATGVIHKQRKQNTELHEALCRAARLKQRQMPQPLSW
jgi:hypothetical protein